MKPMRGRLLFQDLGGLLNNQNKMIKSLESQVEEGKMDEDVEREVVALQKKFEKIVEKIESMKIPLGRRILSLFGTAVGSKMSISLPLILFNFPIDRRVSLGSVVLSVLNFACIFHVYFFRT